MRICFVLFFVLNSTNGSQSIKMDKKNEIQLNNAPSDVISSCKFAPNSNQFLLVSSWDCTVRLYDTVSNASRQKFSHEAPVLDCTFQVIFSLVLLESI